jgi:hypothetical protein
VRKYIYNVLVAGDMFLNVAFLWWAGGVPDETISAHAGRMQKREGWARGLSWLLDKIQSHHVEEAIQGDEQRAETVETLEENVIK